MRWSFAATALLLLVLVPSAAFARGPQTYSDVREVEESGDIVGTELTLEIAGEAVTGMLQHYEGAEAEPIVVAGRLTGGALTLDGSYSGGKVRITARLEKHRISGTLSFQMDEQTNDVELNLPRVDRPRMQKTSVNPRFWDAIR